MTDFYTACRERENEIIQDTRKQLENYQIEVKHRDGVYRHLECYDPERGGDCSFHVYTAPWIVTILGDWCEAYTLKREQDMFTEFLNTDEPNVGYWAEKVQNRINLETTKYEFVKLCVFDYLDNWAEDEFGAGVIDRCKYELEQLIDIYDPQLIDHLVGWRFCFQEAETGQLIKLAPFDAFCFEDATWDVWTEEWIRVCELLRWTACKVTEMEATHGC